MLARHVFKTLLFSFSIFLLLTDFLDAKPATKVKNVAEDLDTLKAQLLAPKKRLPAFKPGTRSRNKGGGTPKFSSRGIKTIPPVDSSIPEKPAARSLPQGISTPEHASPPPTVSSRSNGADVTDSTSSVKPRANGNDLTDPTSSLRPRANGLDSTASSLSPRANGDGIIDSTTSKLSSMASSAKESVAQALSSVDEYARKAVNGVGLVMGIGNGLASNLGTQAYNSIVRVHNTNMDNLAKLKDLTRSVGHSVVELGTTAVAETVHVLDAVRQENSRLLKKATENVPIVRHLVSLKNVAGISAANSLGSLVRGTKRVSDFAIDALTMRKADEVEEAKGGLSGVMSGMTGLLSEKNADSLINTFGKTDGIAPMLNDMVTENAAEDTFEMGNFIGQTMGPAKLVKITATGDVKSMFTD